LYKELSKHPSGLSTLFLTELWERFSYYGMRAILVLYLISGKDSQNPGMGWSHSEAISLYGWYTALVYIACIPGGMIADKILGNKRSVLYGGGLLCIGHLSLAIQNNFFFFLGLLLIILGVGLLKPNISTLVGNLYNKNDPRRDQGFTIFYIGINLGAFFSSLLVGYVGEVYGWHFGFSLAGIGMLIGQLIFVNGNQNLIENKVSKKKYVKKLRFTDIEIDRIKLMFLAFIILIIFWASFEQAGGLMNIYAFEKTDRSINFINWEVPASWFQSINPLMIILFGFFVSSFWLLFKGKVYASSLSKIVIGLIVMGIGFVFMFFASIEASIFGKSSMYWLLLAYFFHTIGELCASPVILSYITKLSPTQLTASLMGLYFAAIGLGNKLAGYVGQYSENLGEKTIFISISIVCTSVGTITLLFIKKLNKLSHGIDS